MKPFASAFAALLVTTALGFAAEPAMTVDTPDGKVYTDPDGMTLYTFDKDEPGKTNCYDKCAANWPPFIAADDAVAEGEWTIVERTDGSKMWAYDGKPLYLYVKDEKAGDMTGDGVGGVWHLAKAD